VSALIRGDLGIARDLWRRYRRNRARQASWLAPQDLNGDFYQGVKGLAEMQAFFEKADLVTGPFEEIPGTIEGYCYVCQTGVGFQVNVECVRLSNNWRETMQCPGCGLINRWRSSVHVFETLVQPVPEDRIYITEAVTPLFKTIASRQPLCVGSEYMEGITSGAEADLPCGKVRIEDVTRLSFDEDQFEAVLSFDVLEHVPDYKQALCEFYRVLAPGGQALISVPFTFLDKTLTRAEVDSEGKVRHILEPLYHGDPLSQEGVLCYYDFGMEFLDELREAGFQETFLLCFTSPKWGYFGAQIMFVGRKRF